MAVNYFCAECNYETEDRSCPLCNEKTEQLNVKDDPLLSALTGDSVYAVNREDLY